MAMNWKICFKIILNIICLIGLIYQTYEILSEYLKGITVISMDLTRLEGEPIPAVTLCTQRWLSMDKLAAHHKYSSRYQKYEKMYFNYWNTLDKTKKGLKGLAPNDTQLNNKISDFYNGIQSEIAKSEITLWEIMENMSIKLDSSHQDELFVMAEGDVQVNES